jgi:hypothetical protein
MNCFFDFARSEFKQPEILAGFGTFFNPKARDGRPDATTRATARAARLAWRFDIPYNERNIPTAEDRFRRRASTFSADRTPYVLHFH